jgi:23S rRNA (cytidine1920-2'-O)/16S rRNA (cytidine1409-2'-O)-methyltransferase
VYALDVGHSQLDWKIRSDARVVVREKVNARYLKPEDFPETIDLVVIDVSFISLTLILPVAIQIVKPNGYLVALIKPQFELGREEVSKGAGVIRDDEAHQRAIAKIRQFVLDELHREWIGVETSPIVGAEGNKEFLACLKNPLAS